MIDVARMRELAGSTCIVGVDESDELGTLPHKSQLSLHVEAVHNAATSTAPPSAAAPSSSWSATPWSPSTTASATWR